MNPDRMGENPAEEEKNGTSTENEAGLSFEAAKEQYVEIWKRREEALQDFQKKVADNERSSSPKVKPFERDLNENARGTIENLEKGIYAKDPQKAEEAFEKLKEFSQEVTAWREVMNGIHEELATLAKQCEDSATKIAMQTYKEGDTIPASSEVARLFDIKMYCDAIRSGTEYKENHLDTL